MKTKLIYVLTCAPEATYIEQALMSIWSARHWNPNAHIVLIVDDKTDSLLTGKRGEILKYISEKIVVPFEDEQLTPMFRSRWIKTQVRQMIDGDFLFVDCDTICQRPLDDIDTFECEVGAVLESHLRVDEYCDSLYKSAKNATMVLGVDINEEELYFSSGVILVRDTQKAHRLYELWHQYWKNGIEKGLKIDQPALAKANREVGHVITKIPDSYNCILFTRPPFVRDAHILHIAAYQNPSFLFTEKVLNYVRRNGIDNRWLQKMMLNPCATMMPFDYNLKYSTYRDRKQWRHELSEAWKGYGKNIDGMFDVTSGMRLYRRDIYLMRVGFVRLAIILHMMECRIRLMRKNVKSNTCQK